MCIEHHLIIKYENAGRPVNGPGWPNPNAPQCLWISLMGQLVHFMPNEQKLPAQRSTQSGQISAIPGPSPVFGDLE